ncbi:DUF6442 family protein [Clostridium sp. FP2]|uniref:DUF6442 family protein n=1 Tax=Clostridium sp. FP2 TaxID=2724481 RepID=UPI0013E96F8E|nr:DUF6442 family protein [Clostridium sp. FP2]MBZ9623171.1 DUF6442 family protein [Clostridium sp. FP2]
MNKEEILSKSREEKNDEGIKYLEDKGRKFGEIGFSAIIIFLVIYNLIKGLNSYSVFSIFWAYLALKYYGKYKILKEKEYLIGMIAGTIASLGSLFNYIWTTI